MSIKLLTIVSEHTVSSVDDDKLRSNQRALLHIYLSYDSMHRLFQLKLKEFSVHILTGIFFFLFFFLFGSNGTTMLACKADRWTTCLELPASLPYKHTYIHTVVDGWMDGWN